MIKDLQLFGKWLNENNQVDFGKEVKNDDYILTISYDKKNFSIGLIDAINNVELNYYDSSCFNENLSYKCNKLVLSTPAKPNPRRAVL